MEACMYSYQHPEERVSERAHSGSGTVFAVHEGEITVCCEESGYIATGDDKGFVRVWSFNHPFCSWVVNPDEASDESNRVIFELQLICSQTESTDASICIAIRSRFALRVVRVHVETRRDRNNSTHINGEMILHWPESEVGMMEKMTGDRFLMWLNKKQLLMCHPVKDPIIVDVEKKSTHPVADSLGGGQCTLQDVRGDGRNLTHVAIGYQCGAVGLLELLTLRIHPVIKNFHLYRNCIPQTPVQSLETQYPHSIVSGRGMWSTCTYEPSTCVVFFENRRPRMLVSCTPASSWSITPIHEDYSHIPYNENVASMKQLPNGVLDSSSHTLHTFTCRGSYCVCVCVHSDQVHVVVYSIVRVQSSQNNETRACANSTSFSQLVPIFQRISLESQVSAIRAHPNRDLIVLCMCDHGLRFLERKKERWVLHEETPVHCEQISTCVFQAEAPHTLIAGGACGAIHLLGSPSWFDQLHRTVQTLRFEHPQREELSHMRSDGSSLCVPQFFVDKNEWTVFHQAVIKNHLLWTKQTQRRLNKKRKR